jgi:hypothetical protein
MTLFYLYGFVLEPSYLPDGSALKLPVFHIDLNVASYTDLASLHAGLDANLRFIEKKWGRDPAETTPSIRLLGLIKRACEKTGRQVAVLVDEYDRPLLQTMEAGHDQEDIRRELKGFYGVLKIADPWLRFVLLTGITSDPKGLHSPMIFTT